MRDEEKRYTGLLLHELLKEDNTRRESIIVEEKGDKI